MLTRLASSLLLVPCLLLVSACGGEEAAVKTVTETKTVTEAAETTDAVDPTKQSDDSTVAQVATEATSEPWLEPSVYSPDSYSVRLQYDTRTGYSGIGCSAQEDQLVCTTSIGDEDTKVLYLPASGSVESSGATFAWKTAPKGARMDPEITVNSSTIRGSAYGENIDGKRLEPIDVTVEQVVAIATALEDAAVEVA